MKERVCFTRFFALHSPSPAAQDFKTFNRLADCAVHKSLFLDQTLYPFRIEGILCTIHTVLFQVSLLLHSYTTSNAPPSHTCISTALHPWNFFHILHPSSISCVQSSKSLLPSIVTRAFFRIRTPMAHCWWQPSPAGFHLQLLKRATTHWCFLAMVAAEDSHQTKAPPAFCQKFVHFHILIYPQSVFPCTAINMSYSMRMQQSSRHLVKFISCHSSRWNGTFFHCSCFTFKL